MNYAVITTKIDPQDKREAQQTAEELGLTLSAVIKVLLKQFIRTKKLILGLNEEPNEYFKMAIRKAREDRKAGRASPIFKSAKESIKWLEQQGI